MVEHEARRRARSLMADKQLGVTFRFAVGAEEREVEYDGVGELEVPAGARSFRLSTHRLGETTQSGARTEPIEGPIGNLTEAGVDALVVLALQRSDPRLI